MEVKKDNNQFELTISDTTFLLDPMKINNFKYPIILTNPNLDINKNNIFNSAGEYNIKEIYFWGFDNKKNISYLFSNKEVNLIYTVGDILEENLKKIKMLNKEIEVLFAINFFNENLFSFFKPKIIITNQNINLPKFKKENVNKIKINVKKVENLIYIFK
jgi:hypothetical protein